MSFSMCCITGRKVTGRVLKAQVCCHRFVLTANFCFHGNGIKAFQGLCGVYPPSRSASATSVHVTESCILRFGANLTDTERNPGTAKLPGLVLLSTLSAF